jgi:hypothetical protein
MCHLFGEFAVFFLQQALRLREWLFDLSDLVPQPDGESFF